MEEHWLWYLTGAMDTSLTMTVHIQKNEKRKLGYRADPKMYFSRPDSIESIFGMVDEYVEDMSIRYSIQDSGNSNRLQIQNATDIQKFLSPIVDGFVQQRDRAEIYLNDVLPLLEDGSPETKDGFVKLMESVDSLREHSMQTRRKVKYDADYFRDEWDLR